MGRPVHWGWWYLLALGMVLVVRLLGALRVYSSVWRPDRRGPQLSGWYVLRRW